MWFGSVISSFGIVYNRDAIKRLGFAAAPAQWADLGDPRFIGEIALCDPTKSGSITMAFENVIQQQMQAQLPATSSEAAAVRAGWMTGLQLIQRIGANARYFTDTSQKPPIDVADGDCAAGLCIDFYGNQQAEAVLRRGDSNRVGFTSPVGGTAYSVDPIALLRGAPNRHAAELFLEYALSSTARSSGTSVRALRVVPAISRCDGRRFAGTTTRMPLGRRCAAIPPSTLMAPASG